MRAIREHVRITESGRVEILSPEFSAGTEVDIIVLLPDPVGKVMKAQDFKGVLAKTPEENAAWHAEIRAGRDSWER